MQMRCLASLQNDAGELTNGAFFMNRRIPLAASVAGGGMLAAAFLSTAVAAADSSDGGAGLAVPNTVGESDNVGAGTTGVSDTADTNMTGVDTVGTDTTGETGGGLFGGDSGGLGGLFGGDSGGGLFGGLLGGSGASESTFGSDNGFIAPDGLTLDPGSDGYDSVSPLFGVAPLLQIGGGELDGNPLAEQTLDVYDTDGTEIGTADTGVNVSNILGIESAQFTVEGTDASGVETDASASDISDALSSAGLTDSDVNGGDLSDLASALQSGDGTDVLGDDVGNSDITDALQGSDVSLADDTNAGDIADALDSADVPGGDGADLPDDGTVYSITDFGFGFENVYEAIPADDGDSAATIQDTLVTPFGNFDLSTPFDAIANLMPGDAAGGVDGSSGGGLLGGLFGGTGARAPAVKAPAWTPMPALATSSRR
jgi:hypothetical protein